MPKDAQVPVQPLLVTVARAAELLGVSREYVFRLLADNKLDSVALGGSTRARRIKYASLIEYVDRQPAEPDAPADKTAA